MSKCEHKFKWCGSNTSKCKNCNLIVPYEIAIAYEDSEGDNCVKEWLDDVLKEHEELQAQVSVLREALEQINKVSTETGLSMLDGACKVDRLAYEALESTPAEYAERVRKLVEVLERIVEEDKNQTTDEENFGNVLQLATEAISEWRNRK